VYTAYILCTGGCGVGGGGETCYCYIAIISIAAGNNKNYLPVSPYVCMCQQNLVQGPIYNLIVHHVPYHVEILWI